MLLEFQWQQIGIREVAVIMRLLLVAHRARLAAARIEQPRLLHDGAAILKKLDLTARLDVDGLPDKTYGIDVS